MKHSIKYFIIVLFIFLPVTIYANPTVYPLGTTIYKPDKCWNGFTILSADKGLLIDMNGNLVHLWKGKLHHPNKVYPGGYLLSATSSWKYGRQDAIQIQIRDFNDNILWRFDRWVDGENATCTQPDEYCDFRDRCGIYFLMTERNRGANKRAKEEQDASL